MKETVVAELHLKNSTSGLLSLITKYHSQDFLNLKLLVELASSSAVHTAVCERGFSVQNSILNSGRTRLLVETPKKLMQIKLCPPGKSFDFRRAVNRRAVTKSKKRGEKIMED